MENLHLKNLDLTKVRNTKLKQLYDEGYEAGYKDGCERFNKTVDDYSGATKLLKFSYPHTHTEYKRGYREGFNNGFDALRKQYEKENPVRKSKDLKQPGFFTTVLLGFIVLMIMGAFRDSNHNIFDIIKDIMNAIIAK